MPRFRLHLEWDDDWASRDRAKEGLADVWHEIEQLSEDDGEPTATLQVLDVQDLPKKPQAQLPPYNYEDEPPQDRMYADGEELRVEQRRHGFIPTPDIPHPWSQGLWIFPDDHPLARYERMAKQQEDTPQKRQEFLDMGKLALPPAPFNDPDPED
jgi:hypothetical protein